MGEIQYTIIRLIQKHLTGEISEEDQRVLTGWIGERDANREFFDRVLSGNGLAERARFSRQIDKQEPLKRFDRLIKYQKRRVLTPARCSVAAAVVIIALFAWPFLQEVPVETSAAIKPGSTRATLTISDGTVFALQSGNHQNVDIGGLARVDSAGTSIVYAATSGENMQQQRNVLSTSRGGEYRVNLADGSRIYLNADTELEYLVPFDADKREVRLSGEAYFEIVKENDRPFHVIADGIRVQVHGTTFTVNTRKKELIQTVLVEGSIGIRGASSDEEIMMTPGQLSLFSRSGELLELKQVNTFPYIAWKEGKLIFEEEELEYIMQTLSSWYDVDIVYRDDAIRHHLFTGYLKKYDDMDTILHAISQIINVDFEINERLITVKSR